MEIGLTGEKIPESVEKVVINGNHKRGAIEED